MKKRPTTYRIVWRDILIVILHELDYLWNGTSHIEVHVVRPKRAPIPITETGYRSHFIDTLELISAGGAVTFVTAWLDRGAESKAWQKHEFGHRPAKRNSFDNLASHLNPPRSKLKTYCSNSQLR